MSVLHHVQKKGNHAIKTLHARSQMYKQQSGGPDNIAPLIMNQLSLFGPNIPTAQSSKVLTLTLAGCPRILKKS